MTMREKNRRQLPGVEFMSATRYPHQRPGTGVDDKLNSIKNKPNPARSPDLLGNNNPCPTRAQKNQTVLSFLTVHRYSE